MDRIESIRFLAEHDAEQLSVDKREEIIISWWGIDNEDDEFFRLPEQLQLELIENDEPIYPVTDARYNPLIIEALTHEYEGVLNDYISKRVSLVSGEYLNVQGGYKMLEICPCCNYRTLRERGGYLICPVCFWEDDGSNEVAKFSSVNKMTLEQAKVNYGSFGVVLEKYIPLIKEDIKERYPRG